MSMTREEALRWFEKNIREVSMPGARAAHEAAIRTLRPVSREQVEKILDEWEPCEFCGEWVGGDCTPKEQDAGYKIYAGYIKQVAVDDFWEDEIENLNFCPVCGRPMTDEAVQMVMERLEALNDGKD